MSSDGWLDLAYLSEICIHGVKTLVGIDLCSFLIAITLIHILIFLFSCDFREVVTSACVHVLACVLID